MGGGLMQDTQPISEEKKTQNVAIILNMLSTHKDLTDKEKSAIRELLQTDVSITNRLRISERLEGESRLAHAIRTLPHNRKLKRVLLTTVSQLAKTGNLVYEYKHLNLPDRFSAISRLIGGYAIWLAEATEATPYSIGYNSRNELNKA